MKNFIALLLILFSVNTFSADVVKLDRAPVDLSDKDSLQRGARNFINYCLNCHSASYMRYNQLLDIGLSEEVIKNNLLFFLYYFQWESKYPSLLQKVIA